MTITKAPPTPRTSSATSHGAITAVVCVALAAVVAAVASLNVALPDIARGTHATQTQLEWVIDAYSLVFAALLLPAGAIGDRFGRRRALIIGLAVFGAGSAVAMTAHSATELIALRAVLGLGAALVMPATLSTITGTFPPAQRIRAVSVWAAVAGGSAVLGLLCSGVLLEFWSWRSVFAVNVILALAAIVGTVGVVGESADGNAPRLDLAGAIIAVTGMVALVFSIVEAPDYGWASARTLIGIMAGLLVLAGFAGWELTRRAPLLDPRVFRHRRLAAGTISIFVQFLAFFGFIFVVLQYLQLVRGDTAVVSAVSMLPMAAALLPAARLAPRVVARLGARAVSVTGLVLIGAGLVVLAQMDAHSGYGWLLAGLVLLGVGMGAAMTPATTAITEALPAAQQGVGSAVNDLARELGGAVGIAVIGSALTATYRSHLGLPGLPAAVAGRARDSLAVAVHLGGPVATQASTAFTEGLHVALLVGAAAALLAAFAVALLLRPEAERGE
jgi:EmrB/QacA subfamily drug resistance transporter